jgi:SAM-dependent methyltransferase
MQEIVYHENYRLEETYWWFIARSAILLKVINNICKFDKSSNILDAGCGTGGFAEKLSSISNVICLDTSEIALSYCHLRGLTNTHQCILSDYQKGEDRIDGITLLDVVEHIEDDYGVLRDAYNMIDNEGYVIITVPAYQWLWCRHDEIHMHYRRYNKAQIVNVVKSAGFRIKYSSYFNTFLFLPAVAKRFLDKITGADKTNDNPIEPVPEFLNKLFTKIFMLEKSLLPSIKFPFGLSILVIAQKIGQAHEKTN